jgi:hypothetical protein
VVKIVKVGDGEHVDALLGLGQCIRFFDGVNVDVNGFANADNVDSGLFAITFDFDIGECMWLDLVNHCEPATSADKRGEKFVEDPGLSVGLVLMVVIDDDFPETFVSTEDEGQRVANSPVNSRIKPCQCSLRARISFSSTFSPKQVRPGEGSRDE